MMIDSLPSPSPAMPPVPFNSGAPGQASAAPEAASTSNGLSATTQQESFANTLQSRLKAMAVSKSTQSKAAATDTNAANAKAFQAALAAALTDQGKAAPAAELAPVAGDASEVTKKMAKDLAANAVDENKDKPALQSTEGATVTPIALPVSPNVVVNAAATETNAVNAAEDRQPRDNSNPLLATEKRDAAAANAAILAAPAEKTGQEGAKPASTSGNADFSDFLKTSMGQNATHQIQAAPQSLATTAPTPSREVATPVAAAAWGSDVGNQLTWMVNQRESRADLVLNPPDLGRIEVSITLNGDQASASFVSANPEVRDALQGSLPRLREVLADAGVFLGQANIGAESFNQNGNGAEKGRNSPGDSFSSTPSTLLGSTSTAVMSGSASVSTRGRGLIDLFA